MTTTNITITNESDMVAFLCSVFGVEPAIFATLSHGDSFTATCNVYAGLPEDYTTDFATEANPGSTPYGTDEVIFTKGVTYYWSTYNSSEYITTPLFGTAGKTEHFHQGLQLWPSTSTRGRVVVLKYGASYANASSYIKDGMTHYTNNHKFVEWGNDANAIHTGYNMYFTHDGGTTSSSTNSTTNITIANWTDLQAFLGSVFGVADVFTNPSGTAYTAQCNVYGTQPASGNTFMVDPGATPYNTDEIIFARGTTYYYANMYGSQYLTTPELTFDVILNSHPTHLQGLQFGAQTYLGRTLVTMYGANYAHASTQTLSGGRTQYTNSTVNALYGLTDKGADSGWDLYFTHDLAGPPSRSVAETAAGVPAGVTSAVTTLIDAVDDTNADTKASGALQAYESGAGFASITAENKRSILKGAMKDILAKVTTAVPEIAKDRVAAFLPHLTGAALAAMPAEIEVRGAGSYSVDLMSKGTYTPLDDGETITLTDTSFSPSKAFAVTNTGDVFSLTVDGSPPLNLGSDNTPGSTYTWTDGTRILYFIFGSVTVGGGAASGGSGDPYLATLLGI